ncbi:Hypothetical protein BQ3484_308 [Cedratvirus A11]|uniref:Uncharacterized protein n=1 Tax=Cedratvirus A11 TaxID=1903266 RepID=A0A1M7XUL3_9VIRU|nr:Hypothetical protein BQ3484_308 [Cedratvirus A11]SHO33376.1 Hypothetical protein BQ3484_308 [Cedratvirus A11]
MDLEICGTELAKGGTCLRKGNKPDGKCYQHCAVEYRVRKSTPLETQPTFSQRQREFEDNLVQRMRSMVINNLRESEERMTKVLTFTSRQMDELRITNLVQARLLNLYEKIIQEKVSPDDLKDYVVSPVIPEPSVTPISPEIPVGQDLEDYIRSVALVEAGLTEEEYDRTVAEKKPSLPLVLVREEEEEQDDERELSFEEKEKLYAQLASESRQYSGEGVLPEGFMERYKLLFPKERRKSLFAVNKLVPPSEERDAQLLAYYEKKKAKGKISKLPLLEDIPGSTKYKPYVEREERKVSPPSEEEKKWVERFTYSAIEGQSTPCVHCKVALAPPERVSCNDCYVKLWQCKALDSKGQPCKSFASQNGPYCKRHIGYHPKTEKK